MGGTGTGVPASARCTRASRAMSCARGSSGPSGGLRSTISPASLLSTKVRFDLPPEMSEARRCSQERILKIFKITGLTKVLGIHETVDRAIAARSKQ